AEPVTFGEVVDTANDELVGPNKICHARRSIDDWHWSDLRTPFIEARPELQCKSPVSALGHKRTFRSKIAMSASPLKADIRVPRDEGLLCPKSGRSKILEHLAVIL